MFEKSAEIIAAARSFIGTPFRHQGREPGIFLDCAGAGICAAKKGAGIAIKDFSGYPSSPFDGMLKKMLDDQDHLFEIPKINMQPSDILLTRIENEPQHIAILSYNGYMIHACRTIGRVVEQRIDDLWKVKIIAVYRFKL